MCQQQRQQLALLLNSALGLQCLGLRLGLRHVLTDCCCCAPAGAKVPYKVVDRRPGDTVAVWAATEYAEQELGWKAKLGLTEMCRDQWAWAKKYPKVGVLRVVHRSSCRWVLRVDLQVGVLTDTWSNLCVCAWAGELVGGMGLYRLDCLGLGQEVPQGGCV